MRFTSRHLIYKALCAVSEVAELARHAPLRPSMSLRFALAYLYTHSDESDRFVYDQFWRCIQDPYERSTCDEQARYFRYRDANSALNAMVRIAGFPQTPKFSKRW